MRVQDAAHTLGADVSDQTRVHEMVGNLFAVPQA